MNTLREELAHYVSARRTLGASFDEPSLSLGHFVDFLESERAERITVDLALRWAMQPIGVERATWARRLSWVRGFARWMVAIDGQTEVPPDGLLSSRRRRSAPHIYTEQEIVQLMLQASHLHSPTGMRSLTYGTLIGLLVSTGLRPSEAVSLDCQDVDLPNGILSIRNTKFGKSRFVPVHESTRIALAHYARERDRICLHRATDAFLVGEHGRRLDLGSARYMFLKMSYATGLRAIRPDGRSGYGPRLQDFRHTFATGRMLQWYREGRDVAQELPKLATYLGHVNVSLTYWYVQAVPELLELAAHYLGKSRSVGG